MSDECHSEWAKYKYLRPIDFPRTFDVLDTTLDVIGAKSEVGDNLLFATICWSRNAFGALGNPSSAFDIGGWQLDMAFTIGSKQDPSNVPL
jgi:hypothetical protein